jgi:hypothetical protein
MGIYATGWDFWEAFQLLTYHPLEELSIDFKGHTPKDPALLPQDGSLADLSSLVVLHFSGSGHNTLALLQRCNSASLSILRVHITTSIPAGVLWEIIHLSLTQASSLKALTVKAHAIQGARPLRLTYLLSRLSEQQAAPSRSLLELSLQCPSPFAYKLKDLCRLLTFLPNLTSLGLIFKGAKTINDRSNGPPRFGGKKLFDAFSGTWKRQARAVLL